MLTYDEQGEGLTNDIAAGAFQNPISAPAAYFAAEVRVTPDFPPPGNFAGASYGGGARERAVLKKISTCFRHVDETALGAATDV